MIPLRWLPATLLLLSLCGAPSLNANEPAGAADQAAHEKNFAEAMSGTELTGNFTVTGKDGPPKQETYVISKISKMEGKTWLFQCRIKYGKHDVELPIPLKVEWAGDTPVVCLDKTSIPGMGSFTARVVFYESHYVGYWRHDEVRGTMSGTIKKIAPAGEKPAAEAPKKETPKIETPE